MYRTFPSRKRCSREFQAEDMIKDQGTERRANTRERSFKCLLCAQNCCMVYNYIHLSLTATHGDETFFFPFSLGRKLTQLDTGNILGHRAAVMQSPDIQFLLIPEARLFISCSTLRLRGQNFSEFYERIVEDM